MNSIIKSTTKSIAFFLSALCFGLNAVQAATAQSALVPARLTCEYRVNPLGIDQLKPELSWTLVSEKRDQRQTAYEILVSDNKNDILHLHGNVWQTGKVNTGQSLHIVYEGKPLRSFTRYYWRVRVYDGNGHGSSWSTPGWFETAMLQDTDWKAQWIGDGCRPLTSDAAYYKDDPMPLFRKSFDSDKKLIAARLYICGLGYYEACLNGRKVGDHVLDPGWTSYGKQVLYTTYDITKYMQQGANTIGVMLGNGWYDPLPLRMWGSRNLRDALTTGPPCLKAQIRLSFADGTTQTIATDGSWQTMPGPIIRNSVYLGERYDGRLEQPGWASPVGSSVSFRGLKNAVPVQGPSGKLTAQMQPPVKVTRVIHPVAITEPSPGVYLFDMGQNFSGVTRIHVQGPAGTQVVLRYGEDKYSSGRINVMTSVAGQIKSGNGGPGAPKIAWQEDRYILKGKGVETWSPRFTFHGFRYVEVTGWPGKPSLQDIEGLRMTADVKQAGKFTSSNAMFNKLFTAMQWTFRNNMFSVQSDCPAREKFGYGGDMFCTSDAFIFDFGMADFYRKMLQDYVNDQRPQGGFTETNPYVGIADSGPGDQSGPLGFQIGFSYLIRQLYDYYGDQRIIAEYYPAFRRQVKFLRDSAKNDLSMADLGDHESLDPPTKGFTASAFYYHHVKLIAGFAKILGKKKDYNRYSRLEQKICQAILRRYFKPATGQFDNGTQSAQAFGLWYDWVGGKEKKKALALLLRDVDSSKGHLTTGIFGTKMLLDVLRRENRGEVAYRMADQRTFPGWGYMIDHGATTLWETWAYSDNVYSQDHPMFGSVNEWLYRALLGINAGAPGFKKIVIKPQPAGNLSSARGEYLSVRGPIVSDWKIKGRRFQLHVKIPANTSAEVWVPASDSSHITENGRPAIYAPGVTLRGRKEGYVIFETGSGEYHFETDYHPGGID
jgi:alpha-L-rhamnosidase